jgi:FecR protein
MLKLELTVRRTSMTNSNHRRIGLRSAAFSLAVIMCATLSWISSADADGSVGTITYVSGNAMLQRGAAAMPIAVNTPVMVNDTITTGPGSDVGIYMADGSTLSVTESSIAQITDSTMVHGQAVISHVKLIKGRVHANVPDKPGVPTRRLQIDSANANVLGPSPSSVP